MDDRDRGPEGEAGRAEGQGRGPEGEARRAGGAVDAANAGDVGDAGEPAAARDVREPAEAGDAGEPANAVNAGEPVNAGGAAPGSDRRAFLRQLSGDAVTSAGRLAGLSSALRRSVFVAGQTAINGLEASAPPGSEPPATVAPPAAEPRAAAPLPGTEPHAAVVPPGPEPPATVAPPSNGVPANGATPGGTEPSAAAAPRIEPSAAAAPRIEPSAAAAPRIEPPATEAPRIEPPATEARSTKLPATESAPAPEVADPVRLLTPDQHRFLADALHAIVAVTDPAGPPHLTSSACHWDGAIFRLPAQMFTARATYLDRDPRVSLLIGQPGARESVMVSGVASSVYGDEVEAEMLSILGREMTPEAALGAWEKLRASGDRMVVRIRPTRFVWRRA